MIDFTIDVDVDDAHVATVEFCRGDANYFDEPLISGLADRLEGLADDGRARAVVLCSRGNHFCAGADFRGAIDEPPGGDAGGTPQDGPHLYDAAVRLLRQPLPIVAAVQGAAIGGGLGLALACDLRVAEPTSRFAAPFARLGLHHGFGLSVTLPLVIGHQSTLDLLYTGRRIGGQEAFELGLVDRLAEDARAAATVLATQIASSAPIAVRSIRQTMRGHLADAVWTATRHELAEQAIHRQTADMIEGVRADLERRSPEFEGR